MGATYYDCPNKPCYLCGQPGHSTATCAYRSHPGHGCRPAAEAGSSTGQLSLDVARRQRGRVGPAGEGGWAALAPARGRWRVDAAVLRLHAKRVTCLEFHPLNNSIVLSGSKGGGIAVWNMDRVAERAVYRDINMWLTSGLKFLPGGGGATCASASQDGTVKVRVLRCLVVVLLLLGWGGGGCLRRAWERGRGVGKREEHRGREQSAGEGQSKGGCGPPAVGCHLSRPDRLQVFDVETGFATELYNANPRGWRGMEAEDGSWVYLLSMDVLPGAGCMMCVC